MITTIKATDEDSGENGRVSYYLKVDNQNVGETAEFSLDPDTGELRTKTFLDREHKSEYQVRAATREFMDFLSLAMARWSNKGGFLQR